MPRFRVCKYCGDTHQIGRWPDNCKEEPWPRSDYPSPYVVSDYLPGGVNGLFHHAALRKIDSKKSYRDMTRAFGCEEVGGQRPDMFRRAYRETDDKKLDSDVNTALHSLGISSECDTKKVDYGS